MRAKIRGDVLDVLFRCAACGELETGKALVLGELAICGPCWGRAGFEMVTADADAGRAWGDAYGDVVGYLVAARATVTGSEGMA